MKDKKIDDYCNTLQGVYTKEFHCNNCGRTFAKTFRFGEIARKGACPICGVSDSQLDRERFIYEL